MRRQGGAELPQRRLHGFYTLHQHGASNPHIYVPYRCYLPQNGKHAGTRALGMTLEDVSGITQFHTIDSNGTEQIYDLNGRQLSAPAKGINIINGKKIFMNE